MEVGLNFSLAAGSDVMYLCFYVFWKCPGKFFAWNTFGRQADKYITCGVMFLCFLCIYVCLYERGQRELRVSIHSAPHSEVHAESISMRWEYHTLSVTLLACAESVTHAESMILLAWEYHTVSARLPPVYTVVWYRTSIRIFFFCEATQALFIPKLVRYPTFVL